MRDSLNRVYVVQYSEILGGAIELGGIYSNLESAINEVEKNCYTYVVSGDTNDSGDLFILYRRENGEHYTSGYAEIIEREIIDRFEDIY